jgi:hypothetical protein
MCRRESSVGSAVDGQACWLPTPARRRLCSAAISKASRWGDGTMRKV